MTMENTLATVHRYTLLLVLLVLVSACATVDPAVDREPEMALPAAPLSDWPALAALPQDEHSVVTLNEGPDALGWRILALQSATSSIDLQTFIWKSDKSGVALVEAMLDAADRGVRVRVLIDDSFLAYSDAGIHALSRHPNISYRIYNPLAQRGGNVAMRELENLVDFSRINHRMHNKLLLVDGRLAFVGGRNQADEYFGYHSSHNFRDMEVIIAGPVVPGLASVFDHYWNAPWSIAIETLDTTSDMTLEDARGWLREHHHAGLLRRVHSEKEWPSLFAVAHKVEIDIVVDSPADHRPSEELPLQLADALRVMVDGAEKELVLVAAYFIPTESFTAALERAVNRGVRVRVFTNSLGSNNHVTAHAAYARQRPALLKAGVELYELRADAADRARYMAGADDTLMLGLHAKAMLIDHCCFVIGSANLDPRSLRLNTELGVLIHSPDLNRRARELFSVDLLARNAWQVTLDTRGNVLWTGPAGERRETPDASFFLRAESWFFGLLPIDDQM